MNPIDDDEEGSPEDQQIARFFGQDHPDWQSQAGSQVIQFMFRYLDRLIAKRYRLRLGEMECEDLRQSVIEKTIQHIHRGHRVDAASSAQFQRFLSTATKNLFTDRWRKETGKGKYKTTLSGEIGEVTPSLPEQANPSGVATISTAADQERQAIARQLCAKCLDGVEAINSRYRVLLEMDMEEWTSAEMVAEIGVSQSNLYKLRERARAAFLACYEDLLSE